MSNSLNPVAQGSPVYPVEVTAPVANTTAGVWEFRSKPSIGDGSSRYTCQYIRFENQTGATAYVKFQGTTSDPAKVFDWDLQVPSGQGADIEIGLQRLSIWFASGATLQRVQPIVNTSGTAGSGSGTATYSILGWPEVRDGVAPFTTNS